MTACHGTNFIHQREVSRHLDQLNEVPLIWVCLRSSRQDRGGDKSTDGCGDSSGGCPFSFFNGPQQQSLCGGAREHCGPFPFTRLAALMSNRML